MHRFAVTGIWKRFGGVAALRDVTLDVRGGEVHALVGENGAGKSTLLKILTGAVAPDEGSIDLAGQTFSALSPSLARAAGVVMIHQIPALFPDLTVAENISLAREVTDPWHPISYRLRQQKVRQVLSDLGADFSEDSHVSDLTMPRQQLVEIARAMATSARLIILDEPTASLSSRETERLFSLIDRWKQAGMAVIYVSHRLEELASIADRVTVLRDGKVIGEQPIEIVTRASLVKMMVGRDLTEESSNSPRTLGAIILAVRELRSTAAGIHRVSLQVRAGEIVGLMGLVGSGRTELANLLFGINHPDEGTIELSGTQIHVAGPQAAVQLGIAYVPEDRPRHGVVSELSIRTNTALMAGWRLTFAGFLRWRHERKIAADYRLSLAIKSKSVDDPVKNLSGGNQQKVALARALATHPKVLLLDEPTQGVDVGAKAEIHRQIRHLADSGLAIVLISSELPEILGLSDRIVVMRAGTVVAEFSRAEANSELLLDAALGSTDQTTSPSPTPPSSRDSSQDAHPILGQIHRTLLGDWQGLMVWITVFVLLAVLGIMKPDFFSAQSLLTLTVRTAPLMIVSLGMLVVIIAREIDISVGTQASIAGVVAGGLASLGWPMAAVVPMTLATGGLFGALNGWLVTRLSLPSIVVTLATLVIGRDFLRWWREGEFIRELPAGFQWFGLGPVAGSWAIVGITGVCVVAFLAGLRYLPAGRWVFAVGSNPDAAHLLGIERRLVTWAVFVVVGVLAGLASLLSTVRFADVDPNAGVGLELQAIAAVVVGGASVRGGRGTVWGALGGVILMTLMGPALVFLGLASYWEKALQGIIILVAVLLSRPNQRGVA